MKTSITTVLSVAGVVAAGVAAFALNTAVFTTGSGAASVTSTAGASPLAAGDSSQPSGGVTASDQQITAGSTVVSDTVTTYRVGAAGSVVVDSSSGTAVVTDVLPADGWTAEPAHTDADGLVKVHFVKGAARYEFSARLTHGAVAVNVVSDAPVATPNSSAAPPATSSKKPSIPPSVGGGDDDGDEDHHRDGDHEDDDEDRGGDHDREDDDDD